jgi:putative lipase involved disintegration of autophagic bodies
MMRYREKELLIAIYICSEVVSLLLNSVCYKYKLSYTCPKMVEI